jgi:hypothetical protein
LSEEPTTTDNYSDENFLKNKTEKVPTKPPILDYLMSAASSTSIWIPAATAAITGTETSEAIL